MGVLTKMTPAELRKAYILDSKSPAAKRRREMGLYTAEEVASRLGICRESVSAAIHAGKIPSVAPTGKRKYVTRLVLGQLMQSPSFVERIFEQISQALEKTK
jgi:excisionase family DNA binding protein